MNQIKLVFASAVLLSLPFVIDQSTWADEADPLPTIRVLALDGGGIRGVMEAYYLTRIEQLTGRTISENFDLIAGTSTGGILALGLSVPNENGASKYLAKDLLDLYLTKGQNIFSRSLWHRVKTGNGLWGPKYETKGLETELMSYFGETRLKDAVVPVLVTGYHVSGETGIEFFSEDARLSPLDGDCLMRDVGRSTSAAPTFFDAAKVKFAWGELDGIVDGGLYKNNPALLAFLKAKEMYPGHPIEVYSFGTGDVIIAETHQQLEGRGLARWVQPVISHLFKSNSTSDLDFLARTMDCKNKDCLYRVNPRISDRNEPMDDVSQSNIATLLQIAEEKTRSKAFVDMCERLMTR